MDLNSSKIIDFQLVQKGMVTGDLKRAACEMLIQKLIVEYDCKIQLFLSDRHRGVRYFFRTQHPEINHEFDIWHLSKSLMKKMKTLEKKYPDVYLWKSSINNHLWWSAQTCEENADLLEDKIISILYHIANIHEWTDENGITKQCEHEKLTDERVKNKLWIHMKTSSYDALKKILTAKDFIKDLRQAKHFVHTGKLESYHNVRLKYMPKRIHLQFNGMFVRSILAILDHNNNTKKTLIGEKVVFSKPLGRFTIKNSYNKTQNNWKREIISTIIEEAEKEISPQPFDVQKECNTDIPKNIYRTPCPPYEELKSKRYSRFT
ncbi:unnamed protein product [Macrosiphum euphorbiae]|uniref:Uncharacterized protein n=1 Tax=Macrosiphum euphorbiae TaxID=13131 RepID=A0AAV0XDY7_9HEMI|nr:unnamed protein product [Macrosiphum euphorbiae]